MLLDAFEHLLDEPYSFIILDLHALTPSCQRIRTGLFEVSTIMNSMYLSEFVYFRKIRCTRFEDVNRRRRKPNMPPFEDLWLCYFYGLVESVWEFRIEEMVCFDFDV